MRFIIENFDNNNLIVEEFAESIRRARAIERNMAEFILELFGDTEFKHNVDYDIVVNGGNYPDEFDIVRSGRGLIQTSSIEVLTDKQAESNEKEEIAGGCVVGVHSTEGYKLGETVQTYKQIGDTKYWYREF